MKQVTFSDFGVGYPRCTLSYEVNGTKLPRYIDVSSLPEAQFRAADQPTLKHLLAHIGMAYVPQLFALDDFDVVNVRPLRLSATGIHFYETYFQRGLAELRFRNGLNVRKPIRVDVAADAPSYSPSRYLSGRTAILMNGGGKDSAVAGEILREIGLSFVWFTLGITPAMRRLTRLSGNSRTITFHSGGSRDVIRKKTQYAGHRPFTSVVAFMGLLTAFVKRHRYVIAGNEYSANFGNLIADGFEVNHQYPKSHQFEMDFACYVKAELLPDLTYFSVLRPLYEIQIAKLFAEYPKYLTSFRSCNTGHKADYWCLSCPKCAFILLALAPQLSHESLIRMFGANAFAFPQIREWIVKLCSKGVKPFECVGTRHESLVALFLAYKKHPENQFIASLYRECCDGQNLTELPDRYMGDFRRAHSIPAELSDAVMEYFSKRLQPHDPQAASAVPFDYRPQAAANSNLSGYRQ